MSDESVDSVLDVLTDRELVGQLVMGHPQYLSEDERRTLFSDYHVGSAIVRTPTNPAYAAGFTTELQEYATTSGRGVPLLVGGDFEAGTAAGIPLITEDEPLAGYERAVSQGTTAFPQNMALGATRSADDAETVGAVTARELRAMGYHWNFAPTADVNTNPRNPVIGVRAFGERPSLVAELATAKIRGSQNGSRDERVLATAKHFPGHGDTETDSHFDLPRTTVDHDTIESVHLPPLRAAIDAGTSAVMPAHVVYEALDPDRPATLSKPILTGLLREELGFDGVIVTDSMAMDAIEERWGRGEAAVEAVRAGVDVVLAVAKDDDAFEKQVETVDALYEAYRSGDLPTERVETAARRVLAAKRECGLLDDASVGREPLAATRTVGTDDHHESAADIGRRSITLVENNGVLPFDPSVEATTLVVGFTPAIDRVRWTAEMEGTGDVARWRPGSLDPDEADVDRVSDLVAAADRTILVTWSGRGAPELPAGQIDLVRALGASATPTVGVAGELPYDAASYGPLDASVVAYAGHHGAKARHLRAAVEVLFGAEPDGRLPVTVGEYPAGHGLGYDA